MVTLLMTQSLEHPPAMSGTPSDDDWYAALFRQRTEEYVRDWPDSWKAALEAHTVLVQCLVEGRKQQGLSTSGSALRAHMPVHED